MVKTSFILIVTVLLLVFLPAVKPLAQERSLNRDEIPAKYKWNLSDIYPNWQAWEKGMAEMEQKMAVIAGLKGTLSKSPAHLLKALKLQDELTILAYRVYRYPQLMRDTDTRNQKVSGRLQQVRILFSKYSVAASWINPEMLQIPWETTKKWLDSSPEFAPYRFSVSDLYRQQAHVLDEEKETLLALYSRFSAAPAAIYSELSTSDIKFPAVKFSNGKELKMTYGNYGKVMANYRPQEDREKAFTAHYNVFKGNINTYAAIYQAVCRKDWAAAQSRKYKSALEASLGANNIPVEVYENLVKTVKANTKPLQRYARLRAKILNLKEYHSYDGAVALTDFDKTYSYDRAVEWVLASIAPLGKEYQKKMKRAVSGGWLDVYENTGKRAGAYSSNVYGIHPYMLLNFNDTLFNVFTLAHELGHTMHTVLANENQPFALHSYTIFSGEVGSTFNERLLMDYLLERTTGPKERIALLQQAIRGIQDTFYFQVLLADFELQAHRLVEQGKPITAEVLNSIMGDLNKAYYGDSLVESELLNMVWARIRHIYATPFYVYQYSTAFAASAELYGQVTRGPAKQRKAALHRYLELLKSGGNDYPIDQLKKAGADLTKPGAVIAVCKQMDELVTLLEKEIAKLK